MRFATTVVRDRWASDLHCPKGAVKICQNVQTTVLSGSTVPSADGASHLATLPFQYEH